MTTLNGKILTQDYFDFCLKRANLSGKLDFVGKINKLIDNGMSMEKAIAYLLTELKDEYVIIKNLEKRYEE